MSGISFQKIPATAWLLMFVCGVFSIPLVTAEIPPGQAQTVSSGAIEQWATSQLKPEDYVVSKFRGHDVIFLGEMHSVRENLEFLQKLIPHLYQAGVYNLAYEFSAHRDQPRIDKLINASEYDEAAALDILWRCCDLKWVTQEYADVFKAAWKLNHELPPGTRRFRIVALDRTLIDGDGNALPTGAITDGLRDGESFLNHFDADNYFWAQVIEKEILNRHEKALVYSGVGHAYTRLYNSRGRDYGFTVGNFIFNAIGSRAFTINIHGSTADDRVELALEIDKMFASLPADKRTIGFDTANSLFSGLAVKQTGYLMDKGKSTGFVFSDVTAGYIYLAPLNDWHPVTFREDFITPDNFDKLERRWRADRPRDKRYTPDEMKALAKAAIHNQFLYQQGKL